MGRDARSLASSGREMDVANVSVDNQIGGPRAQGPLAAARRFELRIGAEAGRSPKRDPDVRAGRQLKVDVTAVGLNAGVTPPQLSCDRQAADVTLELKRAPKTPELSRLAMEFRHQIDERVDTHQRVATGLHKEGDIVAIAFEFGLATGAFDLHLRNGRVTHDLDGSAAHDLDPDGGLRVGESHRFGAGLGRLLQLINSLLGTQGSGGDRFDNRTSSVLFHAKVETRTFNNVKS
jgi:hypothetical protein